jgi:hypothetical protein
MITLKPKERFQATPNVNGKTAGSGWSDLMISMPIQTGCEVAFTEYAMRLRATNPVEATQAFYKLEGAREFLRLLLNLGEKELPSSTKPLAPLNHV